MLQSITNFIESVVYYVIDKQYICLFTYV